MHESQLLALASSRLSLPVQLTSVIAAVEALLLLFLNYYFCYRCPHFFVIINVNHTDICTYKQAKNIEDAT